MYQKRKYQNGRLRKLREANQLKCISLKLIKFTCRYMYFYECHCDIHFASF